MSKPKESATIEQIVYGEIPTLLNLRVEGEISEISETYRDLRNLEKSLLAGFATYMVAQAGYCNKTLCEKWKITDTFDPNLKNQWSCSNGCSANPNGIEAELPSLIECSLGWAEELNKLWDEYGEINTVIATLLDQIFSAWSNYFENLETKENIKVIFTDSINSDSLSSITDFKKSQIGSMIDTTCVNYILINPKGSNALKQRTVKKFDNLRRLFYGDKVHLVSADQFADLFVNSDKIMDIYGNWVYYRDVALENFKVSHPFLVKGLERKKFEDIDKKLKRAKREYEDNKYEDAVRDAGSACETLLGILYHRNKGRQKKPMTAGKLLGELRTNIEAVFGTLVYVDLDFIIEHRNKVIHPSSIPQELSKRTAIQVVDRTRIFYELLKVELDEVQK